MAATKPFNLFANGLTVAAVRKAAGKDKLTELFVALLEVKIPNQAIGTSQTAIAHGLGRIPACVSFMPLANAVIWQSQAPDATNVYLIASVSTNADVYVN